MNNIVADSSGIISLTLDTDKNYHQASSYVKNMPSQLSNFIIPTEVYSETLNIIGKKFGHSTALKTIQLLAEFPSFTVTDSSLSIRDQAIQKYRTSSPSTSFTDCIVMAAADEYDTKHIFGFDEIFTKSGYTTPLTTYKS